MFPSLRPGGGWREGLPAPTCSEAVWRGVVSVVMPPGFWTVDRTWVPSAFRVVRTRESVFKI